MSELSGFIFFIVGVIVLGLMIAIARVFTKKRIKPGEVLEDFAEGRYSQARKGLEILILEEPRNSMYYWYSGRASIEMGEASRGIAEIRKAIQINNYSLNIANPPALENFSEIGLRKFLRDLYSNAGLDNEAFQENQILMQLEPKNVEYPLKLAQILIRKKEFSERTAGFLARGLEIEKENPLLLSLMALTSLMQKNWSRATGYAERALKARPNSGDAKAILGLSAYENQQLETAQKFLLQAEQSESFKKTVLFTLAKIFKQKNDNLQAEDFARRADESPVGAYESPELEWDAKYWLAILKEANGKNEAAQELFNNIEKFNPGFRDVRDRLQSGKSTRSEIDYAKDFITARQDIFEILCEKIVNQLGYKVVKIESTFDGNCNMILQGPEGSGKPIGCFIRRNIDLINDEQINLLLKFVASAKCIKGLFITSGDFSRSAKTQASQSRIECIPGSAVEKLLVKVMTA
ncbi:MAG: restriction endonuclease [Leptospiraceae bacterium]|nr:restriction endonuclease [Leptospiraceae bacterium]MCB1201381.1 restriction endonuclease [Leptospiraceae bacterium]